MNFPSESTEWMRKLDALLPLYGHRNWIVVADSAYPAQSKPGIETIVAAADQIHVARRVFDAIAACPHVRANVYTDAELEFLNEKDAPGITAYRQQLESLLNGAAVRQLPHEQVIARLDMSAQLFRILIIKTSMILPYTSIFFELDCGYWSAEAEERLRHSVTAAAK